MPYSTTYFLEVSACVSLKVAMKVFFRGKQIQKFIFLEAYSLKQKRENATKPIYVFQSNLGSSPTNFLEEHAFH